MVSVGVGLMVLLLLPAQIERNIRNGLVQELATAGEAIALAIRIALIEDDLESLAQVSSQLERHKYIAMAQVSLVTDGGAVTNAEFPYGIDFEAKILEESTRYRVFDTQIEGSGLSGYVSIAVDDYVVDREIAEYTIPLYVAFFILGLVQLFVFRHVRARLLAPVQELSAWAAKLSLESQPELSTRTIRDDEIGMLQRTLIDMSARLTDESNKTRSLMDSLESAVEVKTRELEKTRQELDRVERSKMVGQLAGGIAHDFNNLLAAIEGNLRFAKRAASIDGEAREVIEDALQSARAGIELNSRLVRFSDGLSGTISPVLVNSLLGSFLEALDKAIRRRVVVDFPSDFDDVELEVNENEFLAALDGLVANAIEASGSHGYVHISLSAPTGTPQHSAKIQITVQDYGNGMTEAVLARCCDPFFSTKGVGSGRGLGLYQVTRFCETAGGKCQIESKHGRGTTVRLILPVVSKQASATTSTIGNDLQQEKRCVLLVDDDSESRKAMARMLYTDGIEVVECAGAGEALSKLSTVKGRLCGVISDVVMPNGVDGFRLKDELEKVVPDLPVLLVSGFDFPSASTSSAVIKKPIDLTKVRQVFFNEQ